MRESIGVCFLLTACGGSAEGQKASPTEVTSGHETTGETSSGGPGEVTASATTRPGTVSATVTNSTTSGTSGTTVGSGGEGGDPGDSTETSASTVDGAGGATAGSVESTGTVSLELEIVEPAAGSEIFCVEADSAGPGCVTSFLVCSSGTAPIESGRDEYVPEIDADCPSGKPYGARFDRRVADSSEVDGDWLGATTAKVASLGSEAEVKLWVDSDVPTAELAPSDGGSPHDPAWGWCPNGTTALVIPPPTLTDSFWVKVGPGTIDSVTLESVTEQGEKLSENYTNLVFTETSPHWVSMGAVALDVGVNTITAIVTKPTGNSRTSPVCTVTVD